MFYKQLKKSGTSNPLLLTGNTTAATTDLIDLHNKWFDGKRLWLELNITSGGSLAVWVGACVNPSSTTKHYTPVAAGGATIQLHGGTSVNGVLGNGRHIVNLIWGRNGTTEPLTAIPYLRVGYVGFHKPVGFYGHLVIG